jgi:hypothetical protein
VTIFYYLVSNNYGKSKKIKLVLLSIYQIASLVLPITSKYLGNKGSLLLGYGASYAPLLFYVLFSLEMSIIASIWKDPKKELKELVNFNVLLFQRLRSGNYGQRNATRYPYIF